MEEQYNRFARQLWGVLSAIASGIITSILSDIFSETYYQVSSTETNTFLIPVNEHDPVYRIGIVLILFVVMWLLIGLFPISAKLMTRMRYKGMKRFTRIDVVNRFNETKLVAINISQSIGISSESNCDYVRGLYAETISSEIIKLHNLFCSRNAFLSRVARSSFKNEDILSETGKRISKYEYLSLLTMLEHLLNQTYIGLADPQIERAKTKLNKMLVELKSLDVK